MIFLFGTLEFRSEMQKFRWKMVDPAQAGTEKKITIYQCHAANLQPFG
jgi:hypothetical protein